jgi:hypothetical protein
MRYSLSRKDWWSGAVILSAIVLVIKFAEAMS